jgi:phage-related protein
MLDNLALGFAGTKEGMQELLDKAKELSGVEYNIDSYADIVQAIHVVQQEMGIAGTTAKEGTETISGSLAQLGSAWQNLVAGLANPDADLGALINNVVSSAETALTNLLPAIEKALGGIASLIEKVAPIIADKLPGLIDTVLPPLLSAATDLLTGVANALPGIISTVLTAASDVIAALMQAGFRRITR